MDQHGILPEQFLQPPGIPQGGGLENIQLGLTRKKEIPDHRLAVLNAPQKSRDALGVSAFNKQWFLLHGGGDFSSLASADQVEKTLAHRFRLASDPDDLGVSVSSTEAASTVSFESLVTEPGFVRLE